MSKVKQRGVKKKTYNFYFVQSYQAFYIFFTKNSQWFQFIDEEMEVKSNYVTCQLRVNARAEILTQDWITCS